MGIAFYNLEMRRQGVVVHDILKLGAVGNLVGLDGPFPCLLKSFRDRFCNLANGVARAVVGNGTVSAGGSLACAKPCFGLVFGGGKAVNVCGQRTDDLLRAIADNFKDDASRRLLKAGLIVIAMVFKLRDFKVKGDGDVGNTAFELNDARISELLGTDGVAPTVV